MTTISLDMSTTCVGVSVWNDDDELLYYTKIKADKKKKHKLIFDKFDYLNIKIII